MGARQRLGAVPAWRYYEQMQRTTKCFSGEVVCQPVSSGSKSERDAVALVTGDTTYVLRRPGGNPFRDPELDALVGKHVTVHGELRGHVFFVDRWEVGGDPAA
jgi:hypothetical protein